MDRTLKIFCSGSEQDVLAQQFTIIENYQGFVLAKVPADQADNLAQKYPLEDITSQYQLPAGSRVLNTDVPRIDNQGHAQSHPDYDDDEGLSSGAHHYLVQFIGPVKKQWLDDVENTGGTLREPRAGFSYVVAAEQASIERIAALPCCRWVGHLPHQDRVAPSVLTGLARPPGSVAGELPRTQVVPGDYVISFFDQDSMVQGTKQLSDLGFEVVSTQPSSQVMHVSIDSEQCDEKLIAAVSAVHGVKSIREFSVKRTSNNVATGIMNTRLSTGSGFNLTGAGEVVAVCDTGLDTGLKDNIHPDFAGRVDAILSYPITPYYSRFINNAGGDDGGSDTDSGHGTHVAGSVLGDGTASQGLSGIDGPIRGLAHGANLVFQAIEQRMDWKNPDFHQRYGSYLLSGIPDDLQELFDDAYRNNARIHTNSWGGGDPGAYDSQCEQLDRFVWEHKDLCVLFAAGNDGTDADGDGDINPTSVTSPGTAKNCICVGASENRRPEFNRNRYGSWWPSDYPVSPYRNAPMADNPAQVVAFSSRGPTDDGRIRPDIVAPGTFILSTRSTRLARNNNAWGALPGSRMYFHMGGTSMATPLAAGAATLVRQFLREQQDIAQPSGAMIKAALIAGAERLPGFGPPGVMADNEQGYGLLNLDASLMAEGMYEDVTPGLNTGEIWSRELNVGSDSTPMVVVMAYSDYPGERLINNLNLILTAPDGKRYVGNGAVAASLALDSANNTEKIRVANPQQGTWRIDVVASNIPRPQQDFALVCFADLAEAEAETGGPVLVSSSPDIAIPDRNRTGITDTINVDSDVKIGAIAVEVDIEHSYIGDLTVSLIGPDSTAIPLHSRQGASRDNIRQRYDASNRPDLASFIGSSAQGNWHLHVADHARMDEGKLRQWSLEIMPDVTSWIEVEGEAGLVIPDNTPGGISHGLNVSESGSVQSIEVAVDITHTYIGDLIVRLASSSGVTVTLHNREGGSRDNIIHTYNEANSPALTALHGEAISGQWQLFVSDHAGRDVGKLNAWSLKIHSG